MSKYLEEFSKHFELVDELALAILKGHLIIEGALNNIIDLLVFHPEHVDASRLGFNHKLHLVRSVALRKNKISIWDLIQTINSLRNQVAHSLADADRIKKMSQLREMYLAELDAKRRDAQKDAPDHTIAYFACAMCVGFLNRLEEDVKVQRDHIDGLDEAYNPEKERVRARVRKS